MTETETPPSGRGSPWLPPMRATLSGAWASTRIEPTFPDETCPTGPVAAGTLPSAARESRPLRTGRPAQLGPPDRDPETPPGEDAPSNDQDEVAFAGLH